MTTILRIPCKEGALVVTDTRATDLQSFNVFNCGEKVMFTGEDSILVSGAGAGVGTLVVAMPQIESFKSYCRRFFIDHTKLNDKHAWIDLFNRSNAEAYFSRTFRTHMNQITQIINCSSFFIHVNTSNLLFSFETNLLGDAGIYTSAYNDVNFEGQIGDFIGHGSGSRYTMGAVFLLHRKMNFYKTSKKELLPLVWDVFYNTTHKDSASSITDGLAVVFLEKGGINHEAEIYTERPILE